MRTNNTLNQTQLEAIKPVYVKCMWASHYWLEWNEMRKYNLNEDVTIAVVLQFKQRSWVRILLKI